MTYTFALSRRSLPIRCLCLLLIVLVLWCFFMVPMASAVVAEAELAYWGGAIVVSVLAAGGLALASSGDASKVGAAMWTALKDTGGKAYDSIAAMAAWAAAAGTKVKDAAFRVGADVWQAISDCFNKSYSDGYFSSVSDVSLGAVSTISSFVDSHPNSVLWMRFPYTDKLYSWRSSDFGKKYANYSFEFSYTGTTFSYTVNRVGSNIAKVAGGTTSKSAEDGEFFTGQYMWKVKKSGDRNVFCLGAYYSSLDGFEWVWSNVIYSIDDLDLKYIGVAEPVAVAIPASDLVYPGDDYLVKAPDLPTVDTDTGAVSWPSDAVWTKDAVAAPYPVGDDGVKVPDIPFDVPVDGTTGKALDDAGSDTDNPSKPGEGSDTGTSTSLLDKIISLLTTFFDSPSDFKLDFDGFKNLILPDRFPFCIPFDMVKAVQLFAAEAADFVFAVDLDTQFFSVHHTVDLTPYAVPIAFFRYACVFWFAWILISRTRDLMKW